LRNLAFIIFYLFFLVQVGLSQINQLKLVSCASHENIQYATIVNKTNNKYAVSNAFGGVDLSTELGDSLFIRHLSYTDTTIIFSNQTTLCMGKNEVLIAEVKISAKNIKTGSLGFEKEKTETLYAIHHAYQYALLIRNIYKEKSWLRSFKLPYKIKNNLDVSGLILVNFAYNDNGVPGRTINKEPYAMSIAKNKKNQTFQLNEPISLPDSDFFIIVQRVNPNKEFDLLENKTLSVNPYFSATKFTEGHVTLRRVTGSSDWNAPSDNYYNFPIFKIGLKVNY